MKILSYFTLLILLFSCSCTHKQDRIGVGRAEMLRAYFDTERHMGRVFGYREIEIDPDANFFEEEFPDLVVESVSVSDEEAMILESELAKVLEENKLTSFPSIPFCGYVDTQLVYKASTGKVFSFELLACRPYFVVGVTFEEDEMNADKLECCVANDVIYSILLKKCRPGSEKQVHRIKNE